MFLGGHGHAITFRYNGSCYCCLYICADIHDDEIHTNNQSKHHVKERPHQCYFNSSWSTNSSAKRFGRHQESCTSTYEALFGPGTSLDKVLWEEKNSTYGIWGMEVVPVYYMFVLQNNVLPRLTTCIWLIVTQILSHWVCHHQVYRNWICTNQRCKNWVER